MIISKHCSHLKENIMEGLQFFKCLICQEFIFNANHSEFLDTDLDEEDRLFEDNLDLSTPEIEKSTSWGGVWLENKDDEITEG